MGSERVSDMELDVMLCDHAQVEGGKLFISGAAIDRTDIPIGIVQPFAVTFAVAGLIRVPWTSTNMEHALGFHFVTEDGQNPELPPGTDAGPDGISGEMRFNVGRPPTATIGQEQLVPFAFNFQGLPLMQIGRYVVALSLDGAEIRRLPFVVSQAQPTSA